MSEGGLTKLVYAMTFGAVIAIGFSGLDLGGWVLLIPLAGPLAIASVALSNGDGLMSSFGKFLVHAFGNLILFAGALTLLKMFTPVGR